MAVINSLVSCAHTEEEALKVIEAILKTSQSPTGVIVEAGAFKGGSTAKFSIATAMVNRKLFVFDSFEGIPENSEEHKKNIFGRPASFPAGSFAGTLTEVQDNIQRFGVPEVCEFRKGWFEETLPDFCEDVAVAYIDVDLASSTRTCIKHLYPRLLPGGILFSQDGHLPLVIDVLEDAEFWSNEVGCPRPEINGLRKHRLVAIVKQ